MEHIVAAAAGYERLRVMERNGVPERRPIVAWSLDDDGNGNLLPIPIVLGGGAFWGDGVVAIRCPDGSIFDQVFEIFGSETEWLKAVNASTETWVAGE